VARTWQCPAALSAWNRTHTLKAEPAYAAYDSKHQSQRLRAGIVPTARLCIFMQNAGKTPGTRPERLPARSQDVHRFGRDTSEVQIRLGFGLGQ
jgi:hypothetical protein